jgi:uncharacterized protein
MTGTALRNGATVILLMMVALVAKAAGADDVMSKAQSRISQLRVKAEEGFVAQQVELALAYFAGDGVPQDAAQSALWYEKAAKAGDAAAQNQIGYFYQVGIGVPANPARAAHWYQLAAASGLPEGAVNLAILHLAGTGVEKNADTAQQLLMGAFHKGSGRAAAYLGDMYYFGISVPKNSATAESWYESGVKLHDALAEYRLAGFYAGFAGPVLDLHHAQDLLQMSVDQGYLPSVHTLAMLLINHPELNKSTNAVQLLETAANSGNWRSSVALGILSRDGKFTSPDKKAAYYHFQVASRQGGQEATQLLAHDVRELEKVLSPEVQSQVRSDADTWYAQHHVALLYVIKPKGKHDSSRNLAVIAASPGSFAGGLVSLGPS